MNQYTETNLFLSIPQRKIDNAIELVNKAYLDKNTGKLSPEGAAMFEAITRYSSANLPVDYWFKEMDNFTGDQSLLIAYNNFVKDIDDAYNKGLSHCYAGGHGKGKTITSVCILKRVVEHGKYAAQYVNLTDIVNILASSSSNDQEQKSEARKHLMSVDFLVIDEFDSRFMGTDNATDLFGRILEPILRARIQNQLPTILCTNNTNPDDMFKDALKASFKSLMKKVVVIPVLGVDHR